MSLPTIKIERNSAIVFLDDMTLFFSYNTLIAFTYKGKQYISENRWSTTTGKHLNQINPDKSIRLNREAFENAYEKTQVDNIAIQAMAKRCLQ